MRISSALAQPPFFAVRALRTTASVLATTFRRWHLALKHRNEIHALSQWDAQALKDIGLRPNDIEAALNQPISEDPSEYLAHLTHHRRVANRG
jgi:uncharacterized protein YjiS (DUF1127 family)